jgi:RNA polymerase sigma-70 factor (ECF subfamily)
LTLLTLELNETKTDSELCELASRGLSGEVFQVIYRRYRDRIFRLAYAYANDPDDAEDVTQLVFIRAYRSIHLFRGHSQLYTWLYRIAINCCKDWIKQAHHVRFDRRDELWWSERAMGDSMFTSPTRTESMIEQREANEVLQTALDRLNPDFRSALVLREVDGMSYREVAEVLSCSEGTVKSRIFRARHQLRKGLASLRYAL